MKLLLWNKLYVNNQNYYLFITLNIEFNLFYSFILFVSFFFVQYFMPFEFIQLRKKEILLLVFGISLIVPFRTPH